MPKILTQRQIPGPVHPYLRPQLPSPRRSRRTRATGIVDPGIAAAAAVLPVPLDLVAPAQPEQTLAEDKEPARWFKFMVIAVVVAVVGHLADRFFRFSDSIMAWRF
ncbi:uncharacterized protein EV420DRAFT_1638867 [Desarmillaria tabescens]|uniref:Uncharacterized protein n=1 Tax=Armillaria tabescens TaxID=1929756 RepID=A0AA39TUK0_ARMTA|nr:uncharacterized protein EV420DRAFT_1638867 [Desarmillaria tabescens]KAK0463949.1 hypothetical protein EV420DRAFT_1638867 [Desarmillaria tabescens]